MTTPTSSHEHTCPNCGDTWWCEPEYPNSPCANKVNNGNPFRLCDLCWGYIKPAREGGFA